MNSGRSPSKASLSVYLLSIADVDLSAQGILETKGWTRIELFYQLHKLNESAEVRSPQVRSEREFATVGRGAPLLARFFCSFSLISSLDPRLVTRFLSCIPSLLCLERYLFVCPQRLGTA